MSPANHNSRTPRRPSALRPAVLCLALALAAGAPAAVQEPEVAPADATVIVISRDSLRRAHGTGFVVGDGRWVLTAYHVLGSPLGRGRGTAAVAVHVLSPWTGGLHEAAVHAVDADADVALLRLGNAVLGPLPLAELESEETGALEEALADKRLRILGYPRGLDAETTPDAAFPDASEGELVEVARRGRSPVLMVDGAAGIQSGWSGGPVFLAGEGVVVGVLSAVYQPPEDLQRSQAAVTPLPVIRALLREVTPATLPTPPRPPDARERFARRIRADALEAAGNWSGLERLAREIAAEEHDSPDAAYYRGLAAAGQEQWSEAAAALRDSLGERRGHGYLAERALAATLLRAGDPAAALTVLEQLRERLPEDTETGLLYARALLAAEREDEAETFLLGARDDAPDHPWLRLELAELLQRRERTRDALREFSAAAELVQDRPAFAPVILAYARALDHDRRYRDAEQQYRAYLMLNPADSRGLFHFANLLYKRGNNDGARSALEALLARQNLPDDVRSAAEELLTTLGTR